MTIKEYFVGLICSINSLRRILNPKVKEGEKGRGKKEEKEKKWKNERLGDRKEECKVRRARKREREREEKKRKVNKTNVNN